MTHELSGIHSGGHFSTPLSNQACSLVAHEGLQVVENGLEELRERLIVFGLAEAREFRALRQIRPGWR